MSPQENEISQLPVLGFLASPVDLLHLPVQADVQIGGVPCSPLQRDMAPIAANLDMERTPARSFCFGIRSLFSRIQELATPLPDVALGILVSKDQTLRQFPDLSVIRIPRFRIAVIGVLNGNSVGRC